MGQLREQPARKFQDARHRTMKTPAPLSRNSSDEREVIEAFGQAVRKLRLKYGLTLRDLALRSGVPVTMLRRIEAGKAYDLLPFVS